MVRALPTSYRAALSNTQTYFKGLTVSLKEGHGWELPRGVHRSVLHLGMSLTHLEDTVREVE